MKSSARRLAAFSGVLAGPLVAILVLLAAQRAVVVAEPAKGRAVDVPEMGAAGGGVVLQDRPRNCGAAALATAARRLGRPVSLREAERLTRTGREGATMLGLRDGARELGLAARGVRFEVGDAKALLSLPPPAILRVRGPHFVVLEGRAGPESRLERKDRNRGTEGRLEQTGWPGPIVSIADPAIGRMRCRARDLARRWSGEALLLGAPPEAGAPLAR